MASKPFDPTEDEILAALDSDDSLSDEIIRKWDPSRILKMVAKRAGRGEKLEETTRRRYERKLGVDLGGVRIYTGEFAEEVTKAHRAEAVTIGTTGMILMGGSPSKSMESASGRGLLAHELTHVAQEQRSMHRKAAFGEATPLATDEHEAEAEAMEAAEMEEASSGNPDGENPEERDARLKELVRKRVVDMFAEDERVRLTRSGGETWRP
jgi:Domain of unknown function (DUF4157)